MLRRFTAALLATAALAGTASLASAADLSVRRSITRTPEIITAAPAWTWTGFYGGVNVGYAWSSGSDPNFTSNMSGVIGGGQLGYNWQTGMFVLGIEGDFQGSDQHRSDTGVLGGLTYTVDRRIPWFATLRGRAGITTGPMLFYFTGGGAWLNYQLTSTTAGFGSVSDNATTTAWTIGGGAEWMFAPRWSAKLEYLYLDGRDRSVVLNGNTFTGRARDNVVRVGVNYHF
jgi:outer membrane immunogenic protein